MKCGRTVTFPGEVPPWSAPAEFLSEDLGFRLTQPPDATFPADGDAEAAPSTTTHLATETPGPRARPPRRLPCERYYWVFLLALVPLCLTLFDRGDANFKQRLDRTLQTHPYLKPRIVEILDSEDGDLNELLRALPGHRLDDRAYLPRESRLHWLFACWSTAGFVVIVGFFLSRGAASTAALILASAFTATMGIGFLLLFQDFVGPGYELTLESDRDFLTNLLGFVFVVGLGEELPKALPVLFYVRTVRGATWRGACLWGLASGIGFGIAEGILYSAEQYNGIVGPEAYLTRFISCVALHGLWSASVGITIFHSRQLVNRMLGLVLYERGWNWSQLALPILRVLGIAMSLHGLYDTLLTQNMIPLALLAALASFTWLGWQIETSREKELAALAPSC